MSELKFSRQQIASAVKQIKKKEKNMTSSGIIPIAEARKIQDEWFAEESGSGNTKKEAGLLGKVKPAHQSVAWCRVLLFFCNHTTSDKQSRKSRKEFEIYIDESDKHKVNGLDLMADLRRRGYTPREFFRRFAVEAIETLKEHKEYAPRIATKWGLPIDKWYLCCDFADRLSIDEIEYLKLTNDDLVTISNLTYSNTMRSSENQQAITSNATIFNPGSRGKPIVAINRLITQ